MKNVPNESPAATTHPPASTAARRRVHDRLERETRGEVYFDRGTRMLYATDASLYQVEPVGVFVPRNAADPSDTVRIAANKALSVPE